MKKTGKRLIAFALCIALMAGLLCTAASAECSFSYVALGDSTSMGYMLDDFDDLYIHDENGASAYSVYAQMRGWLKDKWKLSGLRSTDLTMTGMRPSELRAILDEDYFNANCDALWETSLNFCDQHLDYYLLSDVHYDSYRQLHETYEQKIKDADLITYDLLMSDFGGYFGGRIVDMDDEMYAHDTYPELMASEGYPELARSAEELRALLNSTLGSLGVPVDTIVGFVDVLLYTYAHFCINFTKSVELIYGLNPDVKLIVVSPYNVMRGTSLSLGDAEINLGHIWSLVIGAVADYVIRMDKNSCKYRYADCGDVGLVMEALAEGRFDEYKVITGEIFSSFGIDPAALSPEQLETVKANIQLSALLRTASVDAISSMGDDELIRSALLSDDPSEEALGVVYLSMLLSSCHAIGSHPDKLGYTQKFNAVKKAFELPAAANGAYLVRILDDTVGLALNIVGSVLGIKSSQSTVKNALTKILTPTIKLNLFK